MIDWDFIRDEVLELLDNNGIHDGTMPSLENKIQAFVNKLERAFQPEDDGDDDEDDGDEDDEEEEEKSNESKMQRIRVLEAQRVRLKKQVTSTSAP